MIWFFLAIGIVTAYFWVTTGFAFMGFAILSGLSFVTYGLLEVASAVRQLGQTPEDFVLERFLLPKKLKPRRSTDAEPPETF